MSNTEAALPSIRRRLSHTVLVFAAVWALLAGFTVWWAVQREVEELMDDTLQASADVLAELLATNTGRVGNGSQPVAGPVADKHFAWQLVGPGRQLLLRSTLAPPQPWTPRLDEESLADVDGRWRIFGRPLDGGRMLYVAQTSAERGEVRLAVGIASAGTAALVGLFCALWLRWRVRRELAPLADFSEAIQHHDPLAAGVARLGPPEREELLPIRDAIDALGERLARRVANERAFSAHAAHALRTPLAGMDAQLAVALRESPPELHPRLLRTREAAARLGRVVSALLTLFRSGVDHLQRQPVDVAALLHRLPVEPLQLELVTKAATLDADPDLLAAALINLLDNALRHGAQRVRVQIEPGAIRLHDDGQGVPPERLAELQAALAAQDYGGRMGLGLMMADMVARAHGGRLELQAAGSGFAVALHLNSRHDSASPAF